MPIGLAAYRQVSHCVFLERIMMENSLLDCKLYSVQEVAHRIQRTPTRVYSYINEGFRGFKLEAVYVLGSIRVTEDALKRFENAVVKIKQVEQATKAKEISPTKKAKRLAKSMKFIESLN